MFLIHYGFSDEICHVHEPKRGQMHLLRNQFQTKLGKVFYIDSALYKLVFFFEMATAFEYHATLLKIGPFTVLSVKIDNALI